MSTLYILPPQQADSAEENALPQLLERMQQELAGSGICCKQTPPVGEDSREGLMMEFAACMAQDGAYAGIVRYSSDYTHSARLAQQIAAHLQDLCLRFVEAVPLKESAKLPTIRLELWGKQLWFADNVHSIARALTQAVGTYFTQTRKRVQTATVESSSKDYQKIYACPDAAAPVVAQTVDGEQLLVRGQAGNWLQVRYGQAEGYLQKQFVTLHYPERPGIAGFGKECI